MSKLIYVADDEKNIRNLIQSFLKKEGYTVCAFETGDALFESFEQTPCDLVILDVMMPGNSGFIICTKLRAISNVPIIMLTARDTDDDYISGLSLGSDDYFTKPFSPVKLIMRVKALFRRIEMDTESAPKQNGEINYANVTINQENHTAFCQGQEIALTGTEFNLLVYLFENHHRAVSREELLSNIWGYDSEVESRATDDTVKRLRRKLVDTNVLIDTVWGFGFRIKELVE